MRKFKLFFMAIILTMTLAFVLSGCGNSTPEATDTDSPAASDSTTPADSTDTTQTDTTDTTDTTDDTSTDTTTATTADGKAVYDTNCAVCHGPGGANGSAITLVNTSLSQAEIVDIVTNGKGTMPAYGSLSTDEITALASYIGTLK